MFNTDLVPFDASNPEPRLACALLLDVSASMAGLKIAQLNEGLQVLERELKADELASRRVELSVVCCGGVVLVEQDFVEAGDFQAPYLNADGETPMGEAILRGLELVEERKGIYKQTGTTYFRPWVFMLTDGYPTDDISRAATRVHEMEGTNKVVFFAVGVDGADMDMLGRIAVRQPLKLKGLAFQTMFQWLSDSLRAGSAKNPGEGTILPQSPFGWGEIPS